MADSMRDRVTTSVRTRWAAVGAAIAVSIGGATIGIVNAAVSSGERAVFVAITPCRLFDTRATETVGPRATPLAAGETYRQAVAGKNGNCTLPADALAVALNVTVVNGTAASYLTLWPADAERPLASNLNWTAGAPPTPNKVDVDLGADGAMRLFNNAGNVDVLADVVGYYADHNHDDRYYSKTEADARFSGPVERVAYGADAAREHAGFTLTANNGCVSETGNEVIVPLFLPVGATLRAIDVTMLDDLDTMSYSIYINKIDTSVAGATYTAVASSPNNGTNPSVISKNVVRHLDLPPLSVVSDDVTFRVLVLGVSPASKNGFCGLRVEYENAP